MAEQIAAKPAQVHNILASGTVDESQLVDNQVISVSDNPQYASLPLFSADKGTVVAFPVQQGGSAWAVAYITKREIKAADTSQQKFDAQVTTALGQRLLGIYAKNAGVTINPRYGVWDSLALAIAPSEDETSGIQLAALPTGS